MEAARQKRQDDIRARLAAGAAAVETAAVEAKPAADFYTKEEMAQVGVKCIESHDLKT